MKKGIILIAACLVAMLMFSCQTNAINIGIIGDQFGAYDADASFQIMEKGVLKLKAMSPDIVLHVGDMLESKNNISSFDDYKANYDRAISIMGQFSCPWLLAVGDHDVVPEGYQALSQDRSRETWFMNLIKTSDLPIQDKPYYSYNYKGYHFVVLYSMENLHTDPRWGSIFLNKINEDQIHWLEEDLKNNRQTNGTIVLVHHPHWYVWQNWKPVHDILKEHKTLAVIAGHYHYDQDEGNIDGIRYLVMGCTGGVIKDTDEQSSAQEIGMLTVNPQGVKKAALYDLEQGEELEWTPRVTMDRIQALSCMLDNIWTDESYYRSNGRVYSEKTKKPVVGADIESLVNPLDIPIRLYIEAPDSLCSRSEWLAEDCVVNGDTIEFQPGYRSGWANYSTVGNWFDLSPVWQTSVNEEKLDDTGYLELKIHIDFQDTKKRTVEKIQRYYIR